MYSSMGMDSYEDALAPLGGVRAGVGHGSEGGLRETYCPFLQEPNSNPNIHICRTLLVVRISRSFSGNNLSTAKV